MPDETVRLQRMSGFVCKLFSRPAPGIVAHGCRSSCGTQISSRDENGHWQSGQGYATKREAASPRLTPSADGSAQVSDAASSQRAAALPLRLPTWRGVWAWETPGTGLIVRRESGHRFVQRDQAGAGRVVGRVLAVNPRPRTFTGENRGRDPKMAENTVEKGPRPIRLAARVDVDWRGRRDSNPRPSA